MIQSFNLIKALYISLLVAEHMAIICRSPPIMASEYLPYGAVDSGQQYMAGLLMMSGWLSYSSFKDHYVDYRTFVRPARVELAIY